MTVIRKTGALCAALITAALLFCTASPAYALQGYDNHRLVMVSESETEYKYVDFLKDGVKVPADYLQWVNGRRGKALTLSGSETVRINTNQLKTRKMTVEGWFKWRGASSGAETGSQYRQHLFTLSQNDSIWMSVMPHALDLEKEGGDGALNGVFLQMNYESGGRSRVISHWDPADTGGDNSFGLRVGKWHHIAVVMDYETIKMYIDGRLWFSNSLMMGVEEMYNTSFIIGAGRNSWDDPNLNAYVDEFSVYDTALSAEQVAMLNAGVNPMAEGATLPEAAETTLPTRPATTQAGEDANPDDVDDSIPTWVFGIVIAMITVFIVLMIFANALPKPPEKVKRTARTKRDIMGRSGESDE